MYVDPDDSRAGSGRLEMENTLVSRGCVSRIGKDLVKINVRKNRVVVANDDTFLMKQPVEKQSKEQYKLF